MGTTTPVGARAFGPEDVLAQVVPGQLDVRADRVVYTLRQVDDRGERTELWTVHGTGAARQLTTSPGVDSYPRISPDGRTVAFLRSAGAGPAQLCALELDGAAPRALTTFARGVHDFDWSPDARTLIALVEDDQVASIVAGPAGHTPTAVVHTRGGWRADGQADGGLRLYARHLWRVWLDGAPPERLTSGTWSASRPRVADDGAVLFLADQTPDADLYPAPQVFRLDPADDSGTRLTAFAGGVIRAHPRPDGVRVLARTEPRDDSPPRWFDVAAGRVQLVLPDDGAWYGKLGDESDLHDWQLELDDAPGVSTRSADGCTVPVDLGSGEPLVDGPAVCGAVAEDGPRRVAVLALGTGVQAPDVYELEASGPRRLTDHGRWFCAYLAPRWERREVGGPAGPITVHLLHPVHPAGVATGPRPTVLALHGGPTGQWGVLPTMEALVLAGAGYLVAMPNLRGSIDRGRSWVTPLSGAWGEVDAADALAVCDALVADGVTDPDRLGVCGLSYGGFLTQWLVGVSDRFAAAVSENGVSNQVSAWANCDTGPAYCREAGLGDPLSASGVERLWACSPLRNVAAVQTPLLMLQAADDRTCPAADNEQFFLALRALQRVVEYVVYPEESHLMQAIGRIDRRVDRHRRTVAWFDRWLSR